MPKRQKRPKRPKLFVDTTSGKRRGRPPKMAASEIVGRANSWRKMFWQAYLQTYKNSERNKWVRDKPHQWALSLLAAKDAEEAERALESSPQKSTLVRLIPLILEVLKERGFPKRPKLALDYLVDSIAGEGVVSPRRSRDICAQYRAEQRGKSRHRIIRYEYYVECSCGYKGPALNNACRKCGAEIPLIHNYLLGG
jgi:hypothetical protein